MHQGIPCSTEDIRSAVCGGKSNDGKVRSRWYWVSPMYEVLQDKANWGDKDKILMRCPVIV